MMVWEREDLTYDSFTLKAYDKVRYGDTDKQGHVNNAVFSTFLETGLAEMYDFDMLLKENKCTVVIASKKLDLLGEIYWPGTVEIGTGVTKVGNSSISLMQGLFQNGKKVAQAETVMVQIDEATRRARPIGDEMRNELNRYLMQW